MIVYVVNATLVPMKWRWNWFSFQRFHSLPQNFMLDCQCSEMHGLLRGSETMCVTWHIKMWEPEPHWVGGGPLHLGSYVWPGSQRNRCLEYTQHLQETDQSAANFLCQQALKDFFIEPSFSKAFLSTCPDLLRHYRAKRRRYVHLEMLII